MVLGIVVFVGVLLLVFTPVRYEFWVESNRQSLMWGLVVAMASMLLILGKEVSDSHQRLADITVAKQAEDLPDHPNRYHFYDEKGELKLSVRPDMVYYLEAADNYVQICYMSAGKLEKMLIRNTLKNIEWRFRDKGLVRCHRSYVVNLNQVCALRRQENELVLDFGEEKIKPIPVSRGYGEIVVKQMTMEQ